MSAANDVDPDAGLRALLSEVRLLIDATVRFLETFLETQPDISEEAKAGLVKFKAGLAKVKAITS
jgi:hypothetical protein